MINSKEQYQYTFQVVDTASQYSEIAFTEKEARKSLAVSLLKQEGYNPSDGEFSRRLKRFARNKLKLMFMR